MDDIDISTDIFDISMGYDISTDIFDISMGWMT
jgi:hypothetical protein